MKTAMMSAVSCFLLLMLSVMVAAQNAARSPLVEMVETEQAFSKTSNERGTRESFMQFIADDGILFRPKAVLGKQWMIDHPLPPATKRSLLTWQPVFAAVSAAGDMGYTTGPWKFKADINDAQPSNLSDEKGRCRNKDDQRGKLSAHLAETRRRVADCFRCC